MIKVKRSHLRRIIREIFEQNEMMDDENEIKSLRQIALIIKDSYPEWEQSFDKIRNQLTITSPDGDWSGVFYFDDDGFILWDEYDDDGSVVNGGSIDSEKDLDWILNS